MERREHFNEEPGITGEMTVEYDLATGYVRTCASGFWSPRQATAFFAEWRRIVGQIHATPAAVSALVDMSDGAVQRPEVTDIVAAGAANLYAEGDAVAMLVSTSLAKMQMRRLLDPAYHEFFLSRHAAEQWLGGRARRAMMRA